MFSVSKRPTILEIHDLYKLGKATPSQIVQFFLNRSKDVDKKIQAILRYTPELAEKQSLLLDKILEDSAKSKSVDWYNQLLKKYPLFGIPYSLKDITMAEGEYFSAASKILEGFKSPYSSTVFEKLDKSGAICISISNMDEFAHGASTENSAYQITKNPFDISRVAGGSSGGAAASVASGQVVFSIGTDTGGSIRQPSSFNDVVGLKPTYGLVSRYGIMPMSSSMEQAGPITNTVEDNIQVTKVLMGKDSQDQTSIDSTELFLKLDKLTENRKKSRQVKKITKTTKAMKIGIPTEFYTDALDPVIYKALQDIIFKLKKLGHSIIEVSTPNIKYALSVYYIVQPVEVSANLERYDGVRYAKQEEYTTQYFDHREKYFGPEAKRRIMLGTYASSAGYYDAYYNKAQKVRELIRRDFVKVFEYCDILLTPVSPEFPFKIGEKTSDPLKMYLSDIFTAGINPIKIPGLSVPLGLFEVQTGEVEIAKISQTVTEVDEQGNETTVESFAEVDIPKTVMLPTSCQLLGPELSEDKIYQMAEEIETLVRNGE